MSQCGREGLSEWPSGCFSAWASERRRERVSELLSERMNEKECSSV